MLGIMYELDVEDEGKCGLGYLLLRLGFRQDGMDYPIYIFRKCLDFKI